MSEQISHAPEHDALYAKYQKWSDFGHKISYVEWLEIELSVTRSNNDWMINEYKKVLAERDGEILKLRETLEEVLKYSPNEEPERIPFDTGNGDDREDFGYQLGKWAVGQIARKATDSTRPAATSAEGEGVTMAQVNSLIERGMIMSGYYFVYYGAVESKDGKWGVMHKNGGWAYEPTMSYEEADFIAEYHNGHPTAEYERDILPVWEAVQSEVKTEIAKKVLVAKIVYDRYPNQPIYVADLEELHRIIDGVFIDDPMRFKCSPDYNFEDWMNKGESVAITMEYATRDFLDTLEDFECFD